MLPTHTRLEDAPQEFSPFEWDKIDIRSDEGAKETLPEYASSNLLLALVVRKWDRSCAVQVSFPSGALGFLLLI